MTNEYKRIGSIRHRRYCCQLDEENRIPLSDEVLTEIGVPNGGSVEIRISDGYILASSLKESCDFCGSTEGIEPRGSFYFCKYCLEQLDHGVMPEE